MKLMSHTICSVFMCVLMHYVPVSNYYVVVTRVCLDTYSIIESVDSISRDERDVPLTQYITNA